MTSTQTKAQEAVSRLIEPIWTFPFRSKRDRAAWLAGFLTVMFRDRIDGPVPMFWIHGPPASGKTILANYTATVATGKAAVQFSNSSTRVRSFEMVILDNVKGPLRGEEALCSLTTSYGGTERVFGQSSSRIPGRRETVFWATGLSIWASKDLKKRIIPIELTSSESGFPDLSDFERDRKSALEAGELLLAAGLLGKSEMPNVPPQGAFEEWSRMIRQPLIYAGQPDPVSEPW